MSKTLTKKIRLPAEISIELNEGNNLRLRGPKGELSREFKVYRIRLSVGEGNIISLIGEPANKQTRVHIETISAHIRNMVEGLIYGYSYKLKVLYSHFPMSLQIGDGVVSIKNFLGEKYPRKARIVGDTKVELKGQEVIVSGINKDDVGQTVTNLEKNSKVKNKDIRRYQDGIYLVEKANINPKPEGALIIEVVRE